MQIPSKLIADGAIVEGKIGAAAVTENKIGTGAVTEGKIGAAAVTENKIGTGAVTATKLDATAKQAVHESLRKLFLDQFENFSAGSSTSQICTDKIVSASQYKVFGGSSSVSGIVSTPSDNKCLLRDNANGDPIQDVSNNQVYGRVTATETALSGTVNFTNGIDAVSGSGTLFLSELSVGDYIKGDGKYYKVGTIMSDTSLLLTTVYGDANYIGTAYEGVATLSYFKRVLGVETAHTMGGETIDVMFPESIDLYNAPFNALVTGAGFAENLPAEHTHDTRYFTETELGATSGISGAERIGYDNTASGLLTTNVQDAIDEIKSDLTTPRQEGKTIVTQNVIPDLTYTPKSSGSVKMFAFGIYQRNGTDFTVSGKTVTWNSGNAGFNLDVSDVVYFDYDSSD